MLPVVRVAEMRAVDEAAPEPLQELIERAGGAVARAALGLLGGGYGRRVLVVAGPGNNGADGRAAAVDLRRRGVRVDIVDLADAPAVLPEVDLVIDAAVGTGIGRPHVAPDPGAALVLAVDIPSGIDGDTGQVHGSAMRADLTVTFAALKPGLLLGDGPTHTGAIRIADIGLDVSGAHVHLLDDASAAALLPGRDHAAHKWHRSVLVVAGSPGMTGAASMAAEAAQRAGAGMVRLATPGGGHGRDVPREVVTLYVDDAGWAEALVEDPGKVHAVAVGPGMGTSTATRHQIRTFVAGVDAPVVVDGDGLTALGTDAAPVVAARRAGTVLTPHEGEFARLAGEGPGPDRIADVVGLAARTGAVVLLKGPTTVVAAPDGRVRLTRSGDDRLATAGTGDVLTGIVATLLAAGLDPIDAAALGAHLHGLAGRTAPRHGAIASDVIAGIPAALGHLLGAGS